MKPMAAASVTIPLPLLDVEEEFVRGLGADDSTVIERTGDSDFRAVSRAGIGRVVQEFRLEAQGSSATAVHATIYLEPALVGWVMRRLLGRRRLQTGVEGALHRMALAATGEDEFGPEDFADDEEGTDGADR
jgi:hypothetical protein